MNTRICLIGLRSDNGDWVGRCYGGISDKPDVNHAFVHVESVERASELPNYAKFNFHIRDENDEKIIRFEGFGVSGKFMKVVANANNIPMESTSNVIETEFELHLLDNGKYAFKSLVTEQFLARRSKPTSEYTYEYILTADEDNKNKSYAQFDLALIKS